MMNNVNVHQTDIEIAFGKFAKSGFKAEVFGLEILPSAKMAFGGMEERRIPIMDYLLNMK